jgi:hypothetical protein
MTYRDRLQTIKRFYALVGHLEARSREKRKLATYNGA